MKSYCIAAVVMLAGVIPALAQTPTLVALSGQASPTAGAGNYTTLGVGSINSQGQIAFFSMLSGGSASSGAFIRTTGPLQTLALQGQPAPGSTTYTRFLATNINANGTTAFFSDIASSGNYGGIFAGTPGNIAPIAVPGLPIPGTGTTTISEIISSILAINAAGQVAFHAFVNGNSSSGIFTNGPAGLVAIATEDQIAPGSGGAVYRSFLNTFDVCTPINISGQIGFYANLIGGTASQGLFRADSGIVSAVALQGQAAPGTGGGTFQTLTPEHSMNAAGNVVFHASTTSGTSDTGIFAGGPGSLVAVARAAFIAPGTAGAAFTSFHAPLINAGGLVVFRGNYSNGATAGNGLFIGGATPLDAIAVQGQAAPGMTNVSFNALSERYSINAAGQVAFGSTLLGSGVTAANDSALFAGLPADLRLIVREGDIIDVDPTAGTDFRTVASIGVSRFNSGGEDGRNIIFSDNGTLIYRLSFTDGSSGIFTTLVPVPEPGFGIMTALVFVGVLVKRRRSTIVVCVSILTAGTLMAAPPVFNTVALSGMQAPGLAPGLVFSGFNSPVLNSAGQTAFIATLAGTGVNSANNSGIWSEGNGTLALAARTGTAAPGVAAGGVYSFLNSLTLNAGGRVAFGGQLTGSGIGGNNNTGIWSGGTGSLTLIAREGSPAPGLLPSGNFAALGVNALNSSGRTAFVGFHDGPGITSPNGNRTGIWTETSNGLTLLTREGDAAPGVPAGGFFSEFFSCAFNNAGQVAFFATLAGTGVTSSNSSGIWTQGSGSLGLVARSGSGAPGVNAAGVFSSLGTPAFNSAGRTAFLGFLSGTGITGNNNSGIWSEGSGNLSLVARTGSAAPGVAAGGVFSQIGNLSDFSPTPVLNNLGQTAFYATLTGAGITTSNNTGIWSEGSGTLALVARTGDAAPGVASGGVFSGLSQTVLNNLGQTAFRGTLTGLGITSSNDQGLWATGSDGLTLIVREGNVFDVDPGTGIDIRTIASIGFTNLSSGEDGRGLTFNDSGLLAFRLTFTDGSSGIFTASLPIPEPGLLLLALPLLAGRGLRKDQGMRHDPQPVPQHWERLFRRIARGEAKTFDSASQHRGSQHHQRRAGRGVDGGVGAHEEQLEPVVGECSRWCHDGGQFVVFQRDVLMM